MPPKSFQPHRQRIRLALGGVAAALVVFTTSAVTSAGKRPQPLRERHAPTHSKSAGEATTEAVTINYPDMVNLAAFVDYVSQSLGIKIIYADELKAQSVVFRPGEVQVPTANLLDLLRSMLRMQDLALVEGDVDGWLRIVQTDDMQRHVQEIRAPETASQAQDSNRVVTQVISIGSADLAGVTKYARQFLSSGKASVIEIPEKKIVIITDYEAAIAKAVEVIRLIDTGPKLIKVATLTPKHADAATIVDQVSKVLGEKSKLEGRTIAAPVLQAIPSTGNILIIAAEQELPAIEEMVSQFDIPAGGGRVPVTYSPQYVSASRMAKLVTSMVATDSTDREHGQYKMFVDEESNRLYVTAPPGVHQQIQQLLAAEDREDTQPSRPLRVYRTKHRQAGDLIGTLSEVLPSISTVMEEQGGLPEARKSAATPPGPNRPPVPQESGQPPPMPPAQQPIERSSPKRTVLTRIEGKDFTLTHDEHTNSIIAVGPQEFHSKLQMLLNELDRRQPQVLIEMTLVAITFNDSLSLAVELASEEKDDGHQYLNFSSFGLSDINLQTGVRAFNPGGGLNGIIVGPHETPILYRAIAAHGNSRIIATPKVVVSDNTTATIGSVEESPFTSINASDTVATTSFAGYESAGTTLTVTPHIAQGDHLSMQYSLSFSNFTGGGSVGVPPPRTNNTFSGMVEVPDSHTVILGGLVIENEADSVTEIPLLGRIPVVGMFFQSSDRARTKSRVYAFIRPTILRDDQFRDLKMLSEVDAKDASLGESDYPQDDPLWMR